MEPTPSYTLAHLSDPHLTSLDGIDLRSIANKRLLGYLSWRRRRRHVHRREVLDAVMRDIAAAHPDVTLLSGDLTHVGLPSECEAARAWLESVGAPDRLLLVPGNHDRYVEAPWHDTLGRWSDWLGGEHESWPRVARRDAVALIALDCAVPSAPGLATGTLGAAQIERLRVALREARAEGRCRIVMLHHSPLPHGHVWRKRLTDAPALLGALRDCGAELVVHGHGHHEHLERLPAGGGDMLIVAAPSASDAGEGRAGWNLYRVARRANGWSVGVTLRRRAGATMATRAHHDFELLTD
jgi:3',5'-cyclic AMP phosphodiesterase CpdA